MTQRLWLTYFALIALLTVKCAYADQSQQTSLHVDKLGPYVGQVITIEGRTGIRVAHLETSTMHVFTLRDSWGGMINVFYAGEYPVMGITVIATGVPRHDAHSGAIYFDAQSVTGKYIIPKQTIDNVVTEQQRIQNEMTRRARAEARAAVIIRIVVLATIVVVVVGLLVWQWQVKTSLRIWGYAVVKAGPDTGAAFPLRGKEILLGRHSGERFGVSIEKDEAVSKFHGRIIRRGKNVYFEDTNSKYGSWVDGEEAAAGKRLAIGPRSTLKVGPKTEIYIAKPDDSSIASALLSNTTHLGTK